MIKIWDSHNHWLPPAIARKTTFFKKGWSDIDLLLNTLDKNGVEKVVLLYPTSDAHLNLGGWPEVCSIYNKKISEKVREHPDRLIGAGILPVENCDDMIKEIERIKNLGLSCLSMASSYEGKFLDDKIFLPVLEKAEKERLPIFIHSQIINPIGGERVSDPLLMPVVEYLFDITMCAGKLMMSGLLTRFKNLKVVFAHFAGVLPFLADRFDSTYSMLRSRDMVKDLSNLPSTILKNIYVDTSGTTSRSALEMALEFFGTDRILWGSDFPANKDLYGSISAIKAMDIKNSEKEKILGYNMMSLFK